MGTSTQSTKDIQDARVLKRLLKVKKKQFKADLNRVLGRATKKAINGDAVAPVRDVVLDAIAKQIKKDILPKFIKWEKGAKVDAKWPFKTNKKP
jgi:hypothetical protein